MAEVGKNRSDKLNIDVVSDIVCPWCYVGKRHLDKAIDALPEMEFDIRWRPFQLNPQMPREGMDRQQYMEKKFGKGGPTKNFFKQLEDIGEDLDIKFDFQAIKFAPNTFDAHRLIHWASGSADGQSNSSNNAGCQSELVTMLFEVYFEQGGDLGSHEVLVEVAGSLGMNTQLVSELLSGDRDVDAIREQLSVAGKMGISGVPCFIIENKYAVMGAQKPEILIENFEKAYVEKLDELADASI
ncbi:MAG: DsbA family oxidoreductase [Hyphomicrobiales bacterium]|nr:DsbA family oxidoreductase [Hyphomicrobiales bacterium]